ncbi:hypothetical protein D8911_02040 [Levilactobacillus brevis]|nr:hypothetical protein D8911_02040 [Levilactobacillus brevis]
MRTQQKLNIATIILSLIAGGLLYVKITDYYQLSNIWVDQPDTYLYPELFIPFKKVVSFHVFQKLTAFDLAYYVLRL